MASNHINEFELASFGNLCPEDYDEAVALIPSLGNNSIRAPDKQVDKETVEEIIEKLQSLREY